MHESVVDAVVPGILGQGLQKARRARGLTQQEVADSLELARTTVTALEKGELPGSSATRSGQLTIPMAVFPLLDSTRRRVLERRCMIPIRVAESIKLYPPVGSSSARMKR